MGTSSVNVGDSRGVQHPPEETDCDRLQLVAGAGYELPKPGESKVAVTERGKRARFAMTSRCHASRGRWQPKAWQSGATAGLTVRYRPAARVSWLGLPTTFLPETGSGLNLTVQAVRRPGHTGPSEGDASGA
jgi:hypothetical protein